MDMANWQNYRSQVNGMPAVFTANIEDLDVYHGKHLSKVVQFTVPYQGDEDGLPNEDEYEKLINRLFKILAQLTALPNVFFAADVSKDAKTRTVFPYSVLKREVSRPSLPPPVTDVSRTPPVSFAVSA